MAVGRGVVDVLAMLAQEVQQDDAIDQGVIAIERPGSTARSCPHYSRDPPRPSRGAFHAPDPLEAQAALQEVTDGFAVDVLRAEAAT